MTFWKKTKPIRLEHTRSTITLLHDTGHEVIISNITEKNLEFIRENIGRDVIYAQDDVYINLNKFSYATIKNKGKEE